MRQVMKWHLNLNTKDAFYYTEGLASNTPSHKNIIAIEDGEALILDKEHLQVIFKSNTKFETLFSQVLAEDLRNVLLNEQNRKKKVRKKGIFYLNSNIPALCKEYPKYIAGYLGIELPSLSRLRRKN